MPSGNDERSKSREEKLQAILATSVTQREEFDMCSIISYSHLGVASPRV